MSMTTTARRDWWELCDRCSLGPILCPEHGTPDPRLESAYNIGQAHARRYVAPLSGELKDGGRWDDEFLRWYQIGYDVVTSSLGWKGPHRAKPWPGALV